MHWRSGRSMRRPKPIANFGHLRAYAYRFASSIRGGKKGVQIASSTILSLLPMGNEIVKILHLIIIAILTAAHCGNAAAELKLVSFQKKERDSSYGQVLTRSGHSYWISSEMDRDERFLLLQPFSAPNFMNRKRVSVSSAQFALAERSDFSRKEMLIVGADDKGAWQGLQIDGQVAKVRKRAVIKQIAFAVGVISGEFGYAVGGASQKDTPMVVLLDDALASQRDIDFKSKKGEVSSVFTKEGKLYAIANYADASAEIYELTRAGDVHSSILLPGGGATGAPLRDGGIVITYQVDRQLFVEKLDAKLKPMWSIKLHDIKGVSTPKYQLLELPGAIACVGGNEDRLVIYRINNDGKIIQASVDRESDFRVPSIDFYSSIALGNEVHIRGKSRRKGDPVDGGITSFYFIESASR